MPLNALQIVLFTKNCYLKIKQIRDSPLQPCQGLATPAAPQCMEVFFLAAMGSSLSMAKAYINLILVAIKHHSLLAFRLGSGGLQLLLPVSDREDISVLSVVRRVLF